MGRLFEKIRKAAAQDRSVIGWHASERLQERRITDWQAVPGIAEAKLLRERPGDRPYPSIEVEQSLPDGTRPGRVGLDRGRTHC